MFKQKSPEDILNKYTEWNKFVLSLSLGLALPMEKEKKVDMLIDLDLRDNMQLYKKSSTCF